MPITLKIPDSQVNSLKAYYMDWLGKFKENLQPLADEWEENYPILQQLDIMPDFTFSIGDKIVIAETKTSTRTENQKSVDMSNGYSKGWSWLNKSLYVIKKEGASTPLYILDRLLKEYEPDLNENKARNSLPATLSVAARDGKLSRALNDDGSYIYDQIQTNSL